MRAILALGLVLSAKLAFADPPDPICPAGMLPVPAGSFVMGDTSWFPDEAPLQTLTVAAFCLDATEVTVGAYAECARSGICTPARSHPEWTTLKSHASKQWSAMCNRDRADRSDHPVNCVSWMQADAYCSARGLRLPTEVEFEYAERGGDEDRTYAWGSAPPNGKLANFCGTECAPVIDQLRESWHSLYADDDGYLSTAPVGSFPLGDARWGHHDLAGNVCEWVSGDYCPYGHPDCAETRVRMVRGNNFLANRVEKVRAARRNTDEPRHASPDSGFRCAADVGTKLVALPPPHAALVRIPELPSARRSVAIGASSIVAGALFGGFGAAGMALILGILLYMGQLDPSLAMSTALVVAIAGYFASSTRASRSVSLGGSAAPFAGALVGAWAFGSIADEVRLPLVVVSFVVVAALTLVRRDAAISRAWPLAISIGGALGAAYWARPDLGLTVIMALAVAIGARLRRLVPTNLRTERTLRILTTLLLAVLAFIICAREVFPERWFPEL